MGAKITIKRAFEILGWCRVHALTNGVASRGEVDEITRINGALHEILGRDADVAVDDLRARLDAARDDESIDAMTNRIVELNERIFSCERTIEAQRRKIEARNEEVATLTEIMRKKGEDRRIAAEAMGAEISKLGNALSREENVSKSLRAALDEASQTASSRFARIIEQQHTIGRLQQEIERLNRARLAVSGNFIQIRAAQFLTKCFGEQWSNVQERALRFFEEACELARSCGLSNGQTCLLLLRAYDGMAGKVASEVGDVVVTLATLSESLGLSMNECGRETITRLVNEGPEKLRERHSAKPDYMKAKG